MLFVGYSIGFIVASGGRYDVRQTVNLLYRESLIILSMETPEWDIYERGSALDGQHCRRH